MVNFIKYYYSDVLYLINYEAIGAVVVVQLAEWSLLTPELRSSKTVICKIIKRT